MVRCDPQDRLAVSDQAVERGRQTAIASALVKSPRIN